MQKIINKGKNMKTQQKAFDIKYNHIDAPTFTNDALTKTVGIRLLVNPKEHPAQKKIYREPELEYLSKNLWAYKRKLNGENMRVLWNGEQAIWNGKTNDFQTNDETTEYMNATFVEEIFEEKFGREKQVLFFGERMAPDSQGNELKLEKVEFVLFDVKIGDTWLEPENLRAVAKYFNIRTCYDFMRAKDEKKNYIDTLENLINAVTRGDFKEWEGIVASPVIGLYNRKGERLICKIKNHDYLR